MKNKPKESIIVQHFLPKDEEVIYQGTVETALLREPRYCEVCDEENVVHIGVWLTGIQQYQETWTCQSGHVHEDQIDGRTER